MFPEDIRAATVKVRFVHVGSWPLPYGRGFDNPRSLVQMCSFSPQLGGTP
jgi:hypothetical protein